jgi:peptidyl-prolyl cis-trans isomerase B (cyclophilin B)
MIQGGMPQGGASSTVSVNTIKGEFANNGHYNDILHLRGTISMARANAYDSASSQFFICDADSTHLDGNYAAFGYVISGMETVDAIADYATGKTDGNGNLNAGVDKPTIEYVKIIEN